MSNNKRCIYQGCHAPRFEVAFCSTHWLSLTQKTRVALKSARSLKEIDAATDAAISEMRDWNPSFYPGGPPAA